MAEPDCEGQRDLLDAAAEGALPPPALAALRAHLAGCAACSAELAALVVVRAELAALPREAAPEHLARRIRAALPPAPPSRRRAVELAAAGVAGLALGGGVAGWARRPGEDLAGRDAFAAHGRGLLAGLPLQVASADTHTVRPWLGARLPWSPRVAQPEGFTLLGARLDLLDGQVVAALLYRRREHVITVLCAPTDASAGWPAGPRNQRGLRLLPWVVEGIRYLAVSDVAAAELRALAAAFMA